MIRDTSTLAPIGAWSQVLSGGSVPDARPTIFTPNGAPKKALFFFFFVGASSRKKTAPGVARLWLLEHCRVLACTNYWACSCDPKAFRRKLIRHPKNPTPQSTKALGALSEGKWAKLRHQASIKDSTRRPRPPAPPRRTDPSINQEHNGDTRGIRPHVRPVE